MEYIAIIVSHDRHCFQTLLCTGTAYEVYLDRLLLRPWDVKGSYFEGLPCINYGSP